MSLSSSLAQQPSAAARPRLAPRFGAVDPAALARAEAALKSLSGQFAEWLNDEVAKLLAARAAVRAEGLTTATFEALYMRAHDLKGLGGTYEFPLVTRLGASFCKLLDGTKEATPMALLDDHVDAISGVVRDGIRSDTNPLGAALAADLEMRVRDLLER